MRDQRMVSTPTSQQTDLTLDVLKAHITSIVNRQVFLNAHPAVFRKCHSLLLYSTPIPVVSLFSWIGDAIITIAHESGKVKQHTFPKCIELQRVFGDSLYGCIP